MSFSYLYEEGQQHDRCEIVQLSSPGAYKTLEDFDICITVITKKNRFISI